MPNFDLEDILISEQVSADYVFPFLPQKPIVRILMVGDTIITLNSEGFYQLNKVLQVIRDNADGYVHFEVDYAQLGENKEDLVLEINPESEVKYRNFRFSSKDKEGQYIIQGYDEIWCFGNDVETSATYNSTSQDRLILTEWMNSGGGVLAMGDHETIGAAMCFGILRVRTMRRWITTQAPPPIYGETRLNTNRPQNAMQDPRQTDQPEMIPRNASRDAIPQEIEWKVYPNLSASGGINGYRPHPILCGGKLGPIDVLPDHQHEGQVFEDHEIDFNMPLYDDNIPGEEYPTLRNYQAKPEAIAWGRTLPDPPYSHVDGSLKAQRFAVIGVYEGDLSGVGRVVVDSTWHHWVDQNLKDFEEDKTTKHYKKMVRYFRNCAVWLSNKHHRRQMLTYATFWSISVVEFYEEFYLSGAVPNLGATAIDVIGQTTEGCFVPSWINAFIPDELLTELTITGYPVPLPSSDPCWSCPPIELLQRYVLGGIVKEMLPFRDALIRFRTKEEVKLKLAGDAITQAADLGASNGLKQFISAVKMNLTELESFKILLEKI